VKHLQANDKDANLLRLTRWALEHIQGLLQNDTARHNLTNLIRTIDAMSLSWQDHLKAVGDEDILTHWDNSIPEC